MVVLLIAVLLSYNFVEDGVVALTALLYSCKRGEGTIRGEVSY